MKKIICVSFLLTAILFISCKKETVTTKDNEQNKMYLQVDAVTNSGVIISSNIVTVK